MNKYFKSPVVWVALLLLVSCNGTILDGDSILSIEESSSEIESGLGYVNEMKYTIRDFDSTYTPASGNLNVLIVPINFGGASDANQYCIETWSNVYIEKLNDIYFGEYSLIDEANDIKYPSFKSYYEDVSNHTLNISGMISPIFTLDSSFSIETLNLDDGCYYELDRMFKEASLFVQNTLIDVDWSTFDSDNNGKFDAIHFIGNLNYVAWSDMLWPHMSNAHGVTEEANDIEVDVYQLSQLSHLYNADTAIHEQGHLFGLEDYYDYSYETDYSFLGVADMQDQSYFDWNSFSKMTVGWANPYIINGERKSTTITLNANAIDGSCLVIPANFETWNGTPFDEYFLFELFTTEDEINSNYAKAYKHYWTYDQGEYGVKIYHVNGQLCGLDNESNLDATVDEPSKKYSYYRCACCNSGDKESYICLDEYEKYPLINAISRVDCQRFTRSGIRPFRDVDLWKQGDVFTFDRAKYGLIKGGEEAYTMNNGETWNYSVTFDEVSKTNMTVTIKQI